MDRPSLSHLSVLYFSVASFRLRVAVGFGHLLFASAALDIARCDINMGAQLIRCASHSHEDLGFAEGQMVAVIKSVIRVEPFLGDVKTGLFEVYSAASE